MRTHLIFGALLALVLPSYSFAQAQEGEEAAAAEEPPPITKLPSILKQVEAIYPSSALRERVYADVVIDLEILETGKANILGVISTTTVAEADTSTNAPAWAVPSASSTITEYGFVYAATTAVAQMTFSPAEAGGQPVAVRIPYTYSFRLPPPPPQVVAQADSSTAAASKPQVVNFKGILRERGNRSRVAGVVMTVFRVEGDKSTGFEAITNKRGEFEFYDLPPGKWFVQGEADGYYPLRTAEIIAPAELLEVGYYIERGSYNPYDVVIEVERVKKEVNRRTLTAAEIVRIPGTLGDPVQVVENLPGVARPAAFSGQIIVRGSGPQDTGIYIDGIDVPIIYHFGGLRSVIPASVISSIDFYPGNFSTQYGRATGGVFDAHIKKLEKNKIVVDADVSLLDTALFVQVPIGDNGSIAVGGRRSYVDFIIDAAVPDDSDVGLISAPRYYDFQVLGNYDFGDGHSARAFFLASDDVLELLFNNLASTQVEANNLSTSTNFQRATLEYNYNGSEDYQHKLLVAVGRDKLGFSFGSQFLFDLVNLQLQVRDTSRFKLADKFLFESDTLHLNFGIDAIGSITDVDAKLPRPPAREGEAPSTNLDPIVASIKGDGNLDIAPFLEAEWQISKNTSIVPGVRVDYFNQTDEWSVDPRIVGRYGINDEWVIKGGAAVVHQAPQPVEVTEEFGNPNLRLIEGFQYSVGAEWMPKDYLKVDATLFYKDLQQLVSSTDATEVRDGEQVRLIYDNGGQGRVYGLELFLEHKFHNNFRGWATYTLSRAERLDSGESEWRLFDFDQTHILNVIAAYTLPENWEVSLRWRLVSGNPYTAVRGDNKIYDVDRSFYRDTFGPTNGDRLPFFHQLDLRVDKTWIYDDFTIGAYLSLVNTYNQTNAEGFSYEFDNSKRDEISGLPILPILGIKVSYADEL